MSTDTPNHSTPEPPRDPANTGAQAAPDTAAPAAQASNTAAEPRASAADDRKTAVERDAQAKVDRVEQLRSGPVQVETVEVHRPALTPKERKGALTAGAIALPLVVAGLTLLGIPLFIWYVATVFRTIIVVIANAVGGRAAANEANASVQNVDPSSLSVVSVVLIIIGIALVLGGLLVSFLVLRGAKVHRPLMVTITALPMAASIASVVTASIGALGGLLYRDATQTVAGILGNAALGIAGFAIASVLVAVVTGALVWLWMARVFRATIVTGKGPETA